MYIRTINQTHYLNLYLYLLSRLLTQALAVLCGGTTLLAGAAKGEAAWAVYAASYGALAGGYLYR